MHEPVEPLLLLLIAQTLSHGAARLQQIAKRGAEGGLCKTGHKIAAAATDLTRNEAASPSIIAEHRWAILYLCS